jgi:hypothetical protein
MTANPDFPDPSARSPPRVWQVPGRFQIGLGPHRAKGPRRRLEVSQGHSGSASPRLALSVSRSLSTACPYIEQRARKLLDAKRFACHHLHTSWDSWLRGLTDRIMLPSPYQRKGWISNAVSPFCTNRTRLVVRTESVLQDRRSQDPPQRPTHYHPCKATKQRRTEEHQRLPGHLAGDLCQFVSKDWISWTFGPFRRMCFL